MSGAAKKTIDSIVAQDNSHDANQLLMALPSIGNDKRVIAVATVQINPD
jgi:hypothetical protein